MYKHTWSMTGCASRNELYSGAALSVEECAARCNADASCVSMEVKAHSLLSDVVSCQLSSSCTYNMAIKSIQGGVSFVGSQR